MNPTANPLVAFPPRPADWYCDGDCSVICRSLLVWVGWPRQQQIGRPECIIGVTIPPAPGSGITLME
jgi:hypothetical protein